MWNDSCLTAVCWSLTKISINVFLSISLTRALNDGYLCKCPHIPLQDLTGSTDRAPSLTTDCEMMKHSCRFWVPTIYNASIYMLIKQ